MLSLIAPLLLSLHAAPNPVAKATELYWRAEFDSAAPWFEKAVKKRPQDRELGYLYAANLRRTGQGRKALDVTAAMLARDPRDARALQLRSDAWNPWSNAGDEDQDADSSRICNQKALESDSMYSDALLTQWVIARRVGDTAAQTSSLRRLDAQGFWSRSVMSLARWTLEAAPPRAILITSGDANTYPLYIQQRIRGLRPDVLLLDLSLMCIPEDPIHAWTPALARETGIDTADFRAMSDSSDAELADTTDPNDEDAEAEARPAVWIGERILRRFVQGQTGTAPRPLVMVADQEDPMERFFSGRLQVRGPLLTLGTEEAETWQADSIWSHLQGLDPKDFSGPAVSSLDESPIRRSSKGHPALVPQILAFNAAQALLQRDPPQVKRAGKMVDWVEDFNKRSIRYRDYDQVVAQFRAAIAREGKQKD